VSLYTLNLTTLNGLASAAAEASRLLDVMLGDLKYYQDTIGLTLAVTGTGEDAPPWPLSAVFLVALNAGRDFGGVPARTNTPFAGHLTYDSEIFLRFSLLNALHLIIQDYKVVARALDQHGHSHLDEFAWTELEGRIEPYLQRAQAELKARTADLEAQTARMNQQIAQFGAAVQTASGPRPPTWIWVLTQEERVWSNPIAVHHDFEALKAYAETCQPALKWMRESYGWSGRRVTRIVFRITHTRFESGVEDGC
jgi:hypothetical protein